MTIVLIGGLAAMTAAIVMIVMASNAELAMPWQHDNLRDFMPAREVTTVKTRRCDALPSWLIPVGAGACSPFW